VLSSSFSGRMYAANSDVSSLNGVSPTVIRLWPVGGTEMEMEMNEGGEILFLIHFLDICVHSGTVHDT
jgi:hypothetical protein